MHNTDLVLTKQIISAFNSLYLKVIERRHVKSVGVPSLDIIQNIYDNYDKLNQVDIDDNDNKMSKHYDPKLPIEVLFDLIKEGMEVAEAASCTHKKNIIVQNYTYSFPKQVGTKNPASNGTARPWETSYGQSSRHISPKQIVKYATLNKQRHS